MDNATRAARLAEIFGWEKENVNGATFLFPPFGCVEPHNLFLDDSGLLPWLLRELPRRKLYPAIGYDMDEEDYGCLLFDGEGNHRADNNDPLIALVDAVIAAHAERQAT